MLNKYKTVFDTSAARNLAKEACLSEDFAANTNRRREILKLSSSTSHQLKAIGILALALCIGDLTVKQILVVVEELGTDAIIGTTFIDSKGNSFTFVLEK